MVNAGTKKSMETNRTHLVHKNSSVNTDFFLDNPINQFIHLGRNITSSKSDASMRMQKTLNAINDVISFLTIR